MQPQIVVLVLSALVSQLNGLMFELQPNGRKCLRDEVQKDVLVTGEFEISEVHGQRTDLLVSETPASAPAAGLSESFGFFRCFFLLWRVCCPLLFKKKHVLFFFRWRIWRATHWSIMRIKAKESLPLQLRIMRCLRSVWFPECPQVSSSFFLFKMIYGYGGDVIILPSFSDVRGMKHEVELSIKMGLEAKNYESVTENHLSQLLFMFVC